jgi:hypothetical protein
VPLHQEQRMRFMYGVALPHTTLEPEFRQRVDRTRRHSLAVATPEDFGVFSVYQLLTDTAAKCRE